MSQVIFCKTRYQDIGYHSYNDLWQMVVLAGYPLIYVDQIPEHDSADTTFIITPVNGEWNTWGKGLIHGRVILWQLEWNWDGEHNIPACVDEVWNSDKAHAEKSGFRYVPMGGDERLNEFELPNYDTPQSYDVAQISYQTHRRQIITEQLKANGLTLAPISGLWGSARSLVLRQSSLMLHVHQREDTVGVAPLRWCLAAAHHLPLVTEMVPDRGVFGYSMMVQAEYGFLAAFTANMLKDKRLLRDYAEALHGFLCVDYTFRKSVDSHV